jgi:flagellar basal body-associated protein FliL
MTSVQLWGCEAMGLIVILVIIVVGMAAVMTILAWTDNNIGGNKM